MPMPSYAPDPRELAYRLLDGYNLTLSQAAKGHRFYKTMISGSKVDTTDEMVSRTRADRDKLLKLMKDFT